MAIIDRMGRVVGSVLPNAGETNPQAAFAIKTPVRVCTSANIVLNGLLTIDGVTVAAGDRVLVRNQSDSTQNGIYAVSSGNWTRTTDFDDLGEMVKGTQVYINEGTANGAKTSYVTASDPITPDTTSLTFAPPTAGIIASNGLTLTGNTLTAHLGAGLDFSAGAIEVDIGAGLEIVGGQVKVIDPILALATGANFDTRTTAIAATIPSPVNYITTAGYTTIGDGGGSIATNAVYKRVGGLPAHSGYIHSADGAYWELTGSWVSVMQFGAVPVVSSLDTDPDAAAAINLCMAYCNLKHSNMLIPSGQWALDNTITEPTFIIQISGAQGGGQPTIIYKRFFDPDTFRGVFALGAWGATITDLQFAAKSGTFGGSAISAILPGNAANIGILRLQNIYVSGGNGYNIDFYIDGTANTNAAGASYRSVFMTNCHFFGSAVTPVYLVGVQHVFATGFFIATTGGSVSSGYVMILDGTTAAYSDDIHFHAGLISGSVNVNNLHRSTIMATIDNNVIVAANSDKVTFLDVWGTPTLSGTNCRVLT
ncbi:hypothetical protein IVB45_18605 [Bradyrhizobium sp. 4]|uniref:hypothetical protein n=1 Tax=unclassified Bradyrhizobium TaxID=2631580 RepID=UPI001FFA97C7|nr:MULTISPECIES: hypothetical protein [unclassified Bradyrhizobium]MCK1400133.1 hypothetical protein [Bradyrhizobium sp. 39]MCK1750423.1 hypothetical protein [Bradyrhizobium sp. 135]UPJ32032.1 hypothetical protein IVB45_18605 [Bradyrhizobium sp. 4]